MKLRVVVGSSPAEAAERLGHRLLGEVADALERRGRASVALSGGESPRPLYRFLAGPGRTGARWSEVDLFFADERMVVPQHPWSNFGLAERELLIPLGLGGRRVHRILGELPEAALAADAYDATVTEWLGRAPGGPGFDVALLGVGPDGHTASLFPGRTEGERPGRYAVPVPTPSAEPAVPRVTLTYSALGASRKLFFLVTGAAKRSVVARVLGDPGAAATMPSARLTAREEVVWFLDRAAAGLLPGPTGAAQP